MDSNPFSLTGKVILVTGASRGLGWAMSCGLAAAGAHVVLNGREVDLLDQRADELREKGHTCSTAPFDVGEAQAIRSGVSEVIGRVGRLDGLIANAGYTFRKPFTEMNDGEWRHVMATDFDSAFVLAQSVTEPMLAGGGGSIAFVSSILGLIGRAQVSAYCAAKAGLIGLTNSLAAELGPKGIRSNAIAPGYFGTDGTRAVYENPEFHAMICRRTPLGRWGDPSELAGVGVFLMSSASSYVNGAVIAVDGGVTATL